MPPRPSVFFLSPNLLAPLIFGPPLIYPFFSRITPPIITTTHIHPPPIIHHHGASSPTTTVKATMSSSAPTASHQALIRSLAARRILSSQRIIDVMNVVDRGRYVNINPYVDTPQLIGWMATISAPHMHAMALELLDDWLVPGAQALDVGCGSGYLVACMARMVEGSGDGNDRGKVIGVEHVRGLCNLSRRNLEADVPQLVRDGVIEIKCADGREGVEGKQFDAIHVGAASLGMPDGLVASLKKGGRMVVPIEDSTGMQTLTCIDKLQDGTLSTKSVTGVRYVPLCDLKEQLGNSD